MDDMLDAFLTEAAESLPELDHDVLLFDDLEIIDDISLCNDIDPHQPR
jgi:hypothetical protein